MRSRKVVSINATTDWVEAQVEMPAKTIIKRIRAEAQAPGTSVAVSLREKTAPESILDIPLEYSLDTSPLDSEEDTYIQLEKLISSSRGTMGTLYLAAKSNTSCVVKVLIEFEV